MANEDKSTRYHRLRRRAVVLTWSWRAVYLAGVMLTGASVALRDAITSLAGPGHVRAVVGLVLALAVGYGIVRLPLAFYEEVSLERRFGLSTASPARWSAAHLKSAVVWLGCLLTAALLVSSLLRWSPDRWWIAAATAGAIGLALLVQLVPAWLLQRSDDIRPLASEELRRRLLALAGRARAPVVGVFEWRVGAHTRRANATLVGLGRSRRILVSDTLLAGHSQEEIEAVVAHELAHHVHRDLWSVIAVRSALVALGCYLADVVLASAVAPLGLDGKADVAGLPLLALAGGAVALLLLPVSNALSRAHERRADRWALEATGNPAAFVSAMRRLAARNLAEERPSRLVELLFHTHPSAAARIEAARDPPAQPGGQRS